MYYPFSRLLAGAFYTPAGRRLNFFGEILKIP